MPRTRSVRLLPNKAFRLSPDPPPEPFNVGIRRAFSNDYRRRTQVRAGLHNPLKVFEGLLDGRSGRGSLKGPLRSLIVVKLKESNKLGHVARGSSPNGVGLAPMPPWVASH